MPSKKLPNLRIDSVVSDLWYQLVATNSSGTFLKPYTSQQLESLNDAANNLLNLSVNISGTPQIRGKDANAAINEIDRLIPLLDEFIESTSNASLKIDSGSKNKQIYDSTLSIIKDAKQKLVISKIALKNVAHLHTRIKQIQSTNIESSLTAQGREEGKIVFINDLNASELGSYNLSSRTIGITAVGFGRKLFADPAGTFAHEIQHRQEDILLSNTTNYSKILAQFEKTQYFNQIKSQWEQIYKNKFGEFGNDEEGIEYKKYYLSAKEILAREFETIARTGFPRTKQAGEFFSLLIKNKLLLKDDILIQHKLYKELVELSKAEIGRAPIPLESIRNFSLADDDYAQNIPEELLGGRSGGGYVNKRGVYYLAENGEEYVISARALKDLERLKGGKIGDADLAGAFRTRADVQKVLRQKNAIRKSRRSLPTSGPQGAAGPTPTTAEVYQMFDEAEQAAGFTGGGGGTGGTATGGTGTTRTARPFAGQLTPDQLRTQYPAAHAFASSQGFALNDSTKIKAVQDLEKGLVNLTLSSSEAGKAVQKLNLVIDQAGTVSTKQTFLSTQKELGKLAQTDVKIAQYAEEREANFLARMKQNPTPFAAAFKENPALENAQPGQRGVRVTSSTSGLQHYTFSNTNPETGLTDTTIKSVDKLGRVIEPFNKKMADFGTSIKREMGEFLRWTIAISLIYAPLQKMNELVQLAIQNQVLLTNVTITLGKSQEYANRIFTDAAVIARETGVSITSVLEGYNLAVRATGNVSDETEKFRIANVLLKDSITLSKLAMMDQATATDTLVAALRQVGWGLDKGQELLDSWVKVSRSANVDVNTLATSFAITGEAAMNAGVNVDQLNSIIAKIAETGISSAKETGNAVKSLFTGYSSESAAKEFARFGISVTDARGEARSFVDVMNDVSSSIQAGQMTGSQVKQVGRPVVGGARRLPMWEALVNNWSGVSSLTDLSSNAKGEAQRALQMSLDTLATRSVDLGNAFQELAQVIGNSGILDLISNMVTGFSALVRGLNPLIEFFGSALPIMGVALLGKKMGVGGAASNFIGSMAMGAAGIGNPAFKEAKSMMEEFKVKSFNELRALTQTSQMSLAQRSKVYTLDRATGGYGEEAANKMSLAVSRFSAFLPGMVMGLSEMSRGNVAGGLGVGGASIAGGLLAGFKTGFNAQAMSVGSMVAATFAEIIVNGIQQTKEATLTGPTRWNPKGLGYTDTYDTGQKLVESDMEKINQQAGGEIIGWLRQASNNVFATLGGGPQATSAEIATAYAWEKAAKYGDLAKQEEAKLLGLITMTTKDIQVSQLKKEMLTGGTGLRLPYTSFQEQYGYGNLTTSIQEQAKAELDNRFKDPKYKLSAREYTEDTKNIEAFNVALPRLMAPLMGNFTGLGDSLTTADQAIKGFADILVYGSADTIQGLNDLQTEFGTLTNYIAMAELAGGKVGVYNQVTGEEETKTTAELKAKRDAVAASYRTAVGMAYPEVIASKTVVPNISDYTKYGRGDISSIEQRAREYQASYAKQLTPDERTSYMAAEAVQEFYTEDIVGTIVKTLGVSESLMAKATEDLIKEGIIKPIDEAKTGLTGVDYTQQEYQDLLAQYPAYEKKVMDFNQANGLNYELNKQKTIVQTSEGSLLVQDVDNAIFQLLMQENNELQRKQLDGLYNLPENMSFWLPSQALDLAPGAGGGAGGGENVPPVEAPNTSPTTPYVSPFPPYTGGNPRSMPRVDSDPKVWDDFRKYSGPSNFFDRDFQIGPKSFGQKMRDISSMVSGKNPTVNASLRLALTSSVTLVLGDTVLARAVDKIMADKLVRFGSANGSSSNLQVR